MRTRTIKLKCSLEGCGEFEADVEFGQYIELDNGVDCQIFQERPGRKDIPLRDIVCPVCGCIGKLSFV